MNNISKPDLISILKNCQQGDITREALQEWMIHNYDPGEVEIGKGEASHTVEAMNIVMNEYEIVALEKMTEQSCALAIAYINSSAADNQDAKAQFLNDGFID